MLPALQTVPLIPPTCVPQLLSLSGPCNVQPGGPEQGRHRHQPAASAGWRHPEQRETAESNAEVTQVSHPTTKCLVSDVFHLQYIQMGSFSLTNIHVISEMFYLFLWGQASVSSLSVSVLSTPETLRGKAAPWRPRGDRRPAGWGRGTNIFPAETGLISFQWLHKKIMSSCVFSFAGAQAALWS